MMVWFDSYDNVWFKAVGGFNMVYWMMSANLVWVDEL